MTFNALLREFQISENELSIKDNISIITKLNWKYADALDFQYAANDFIYNNPEQSIFILTSHPNVLTMGRGLQRDMIEKYQLTEYNIEVEDQLPVEVYKVKRGGGLTFHHPGQIVLYPIIHIGHHKIKTLKLINNIFEIAKLSIEELTSLEGFDYHRDLLGLWYKDHKVASMGIQLKKFVTLHGLALNVSRDRVMSEVLKKVSPCGIDGNNYRCLNDLIDTDRDSLLNMISSNVLDGKILLK